MTPDILNYQYLCQKWDINTTFSYVKATQSGWDHKKISIFTLAS